MVRVGKKIYVSGRLGRDEHVRSVMGLLRAHGHTVTFDWTLYTPGVNIDHNTLAERELCAVGDSELLVVASVTEGGVGCWLEVGAALAKPIPVLLVGQCRESLFWHLHGVHRVANNADMIRWIADHV